MPGIDEIYDAICDEAAYARVPSVLAHATKARSAVMLELDDSMQSQTWVRHAVSDDVVDRYARLDLWRHDIWCHLMARPSHRGRAVRSDEVVDVESFRGSVFYNELYKPLGDDTARCLGIVLDRPGGHLAIGLHRAYGQPIFDEVDTAALQVLVPHLRRLVAARSRLQQAETQAVRLTAALDELACGLVFVGADGQLRHANRAAEALLKARDGVMVQRGRVVPIDHPIAARFAEAVRSAATATGARGDAMRLRRSGAPSLTVLVVPIAGALPGALVLLDSQDRTQAMPEVLARLYDLTPTEAELGALLGQGLSPDQAAAERGVRVSTVRSQIKALLHKTETRRLGDLLRTLGRISRLI